MFLIAAPALAAAPGGIILIFLTDGTSPKFPVGRAISGRLVAPLKISPGRGRRGGAPEFLELFD
jgi:hypothetical protein